MLRINTKSWKRLDLNVRELSIIKWEIKKFNVYILQELIVF